MYGPERKQYTPMDMMKQRVEKGEFGKTTAEQTSEENLKEKHIPEVEQYLKEKAKGQKRVDEELEGIITEKYGQQLEDTRHQE